MPDPVVTRPKLTRFLSAMTGAALGYGRGGFLLGGPYGPGQFTPPSYLAPAWHPDRLMLPPLSAAERATFRQLTS